MERIGSLEWSDGVMRGVDDFAVGARHIVLVAPPWYPVPPQGYGGIELVVALLARELRRRGHRVTVFGAEGSEPGVRVLAPRQWSTALGHPEERQRSIAYAARVLETVVELDAVDVIHDHSGAITLLGLAWLGVAPVVHTIHGALSAVDREMYAELGERVGMVAISNAQRASAPDVPWLATVHNAVDVDQLLVGNRDEREGYLLCLARICPDKGQHLAIEVARRTGKKLVLAGKIEPTPEGRRYYEERIAPAVDGVSVVHLHDVGGLAKAQLLARADALLAPIQWEEPFGLAIVEAMASGTPAIVMRRGAAPELVVEGKTGFLVDDVEEMVERVAHVEEIDPQECARLTRQRFSPQAMADGYLAAYAAAQGAVEAPVAASEWTTIAQVVD